MPRQPAYAAEGTPWARTWPPGWTVQHVGETASTNAELLATAAERPDRSVLVADHQTAGRGRLDRRWDAPAGANLLVSLLFHVVPADPSELVRRVSLAALDGSRVLRPGIDVRLKWPNDIVLVERSQPSAKLAGVLAQRDQSGAVVVGLGINVGWCPDGAARLGDAVDRAALLAALLDAYDRLPQGADELGARYRGELATLGQRVRVEMPGGALVGTAIGVAEGGQLVVRGDDGRVRELDVADVTHLRPQ